ncbi:hypothetical protein A5717_25975 [Mycolicibacterium porcinum]|uniref:hypothetical protein n=1 Tax=Mycolicibacterium porcinum TaxID=39693 RepID=UPI00080BD426|nr:hypothetical protein [Mycolicibacterium porcinum]OCB09226.1 hypothetical protein A5717_25975 [Mycolicibacterium porcinum]
MAATSPKKKATAKGSSGAPRVVAAPGEPTGRFAQLLAQARHKGMAIEPYEITEDLVLQPPTEDRLKALDQLSAAHILAQAAVVDLMRTQGEPPDDHELRMVWSKQRNAELAEAYRACEDAVTSYNVVLFGGEDEYQRVNEFFATRPEWEKRAFEQDIREQFLRLPVDDVCPACHQVVNPEVGESDAESSGTSTTSGTTSTSTSPENSAAATSGTGSEDLDPGSSSSTTPTSLPE